MGKLILSDVDGTILRHGAEIASPRVADAIISALKAGNVLVPVTSRTAKLMASLAAQVGLRHMGVLDGGATIFNFRHNTRNANLSRWMGPEQTSSVLQAIEPDCNKVYYGEDSQLYTPGARIDSSSPAVFAEYPNAAKPRILHALSAIAGITAHDNRYEDSDTQSCVQVVSKGVSKLSGVQLLLEDPRYADFAPEDVVALGDGDPDVDLFRAIPLEACRIAIGSNPRLLEIPGTVNVPPASEDGFAVAMERFVLR